MTRRRKQHIPKRLLHKLQKAKAVWAAAKSQAEEAKRSGELKAGRRPKKLSAKAELDKAILREALEGS